MVEDLLGEIFGSWIGHDPRANLTCAGESETFWLNQMQMAELFGVDVHTVNEHLRNIYDSGELSERATLRKIRIVRTEGTCEVVLDIAFYNLDAIISVGYRVNNAQATQFRIWAT